MGPATHFGEMLDPYLAGTGPLDIRSRALQSSRAPGF